MKKNKLTKLIKELIIKKNGISVSQYMKMCLTHPDYGYYTKKRPIGLKGDFITSPEISQMFGELIGLWIAQVWLDHNKPSKFSIVELGPGNGTLMADILRVTNKIKGFHNSLIITLIEISPALKKLQKTKLKDYCVNWKANLEKLPNVPTVIFANEFFDALPINQYVVKNCKWMEVVVSLKSFINPICDEFCFELKKISKPPLELSFLEQTEDNIFEISIELKKNLSFIFKHLNKNLGACLIIDYGKNNSVGSTLQAVKNHQFSNPLENHGECDLTSLVNFNMIKKYSQYYGLKVSNLVDQGDFLKSLGIEQRYLSLSKSMDPNQLKMHNKSLNRLINKNQMGKLFKVMGIRNKRSSPLIGLEV